MLTSTAAGGLYQHAAFQADIFTHSIKSAIAQKFSWMLSILSGEDFVRHLGSCACSGNTLDQPGLLQYACQLKTNIRPSSAATVSTPDDAKDSDLEVMAGVLGGRPILALCFEDMEVCSKT